MKRRLWPFGLIYLIGAVTAFWAARPGAGERNQDEGSPWTRIPVSSIQSINYTGDDLNVTLEVLHESLARITYKRGKEEDKVFLSNDTELLRNIWHDLDPVWAQKRIGKAKDLKLEDYGLDKDVASFRIELKEGKKPIEFKLGKRSFQSKSAFVQDPLNDEVFLWDLEVIGLLGSAPKELAIDIPMAFGDKALSKVVLTRGKENAEWYFRAGKWQRDEYIEDPDFFPWFIKLQNIKLDAYPTPEQTAALSKVEPLLVVNVEEKGGGGKQYAMSIIPETTKDGNAYWLSDPRFPSLMRLDAQKLKLLLDELPSVMTYPDQKKQKK